MGNSTDSPEVLLALTNWLQRPIGQSASRRLPGIPCSLASDIGVTRKENQDRVAVSRFRDSRGRPYLLLTLADGMGGLADGGQCASLVIGAFTAYVFDEAAEALSAREKMLRAAELANGLVHQSWGGAAGATLVALLISEAGESCWLSVGDSRVYHKGPSAVNQLSTDDTLAGQLGRAGGASDERGHLLQFMGMGAGIEPHVDRFDTSEGGMLMLTSDGVHYLATGRLFSQVVLNAIDEYVTARRLIELARWSGGPDNASIVTLTIGSAIYSGLRQARRYLEVFDPYGDLSLLVVAPPVPTPARSPNTPLSDEPREVRDNVDAPIASASRDDLDGSGNRSKKKVRKAKRSKKDGSLDVDEDVQINLLGKDGE